MLTREWIWEPQEAEPTKEAAKSFRDDGFILVDFSKVPKASSDSNTSKQSQEQDHSSEYSLKTFPKRDRRDPMLVTVTGPANFIIELVPHPDPTPSNRDCSSEALVSFISSLSPRRMPSSTLDTLDHPFPLVIVLSSSSISASTCRDHTVHPSREPSKIEEYASSWFAHSSSLYYGSDHLLHVDASHLFLPSSIRILLGLPFNQRIRSYCCFFLSGTLLQLLTHVPRLHFVDLVPVDSKDISGNGNTGRRHSGQNVRVSPEDEREGSFLSEFKSCYRHSHRTSPLCMAHCR